MSSSPTDLEAAAGAANGVGGPTGDAGRALVDVLMPKMGTSVAEGTVVEWQVAVGEAVEADQGLCVISTDKVDSDCPSPASGVLAEILVADGETVDVGTVIGRVAVGGGRPTGAPGSPGDGVSGEGETGGSVSVEGAAAGGAVGSVAAGGQAAGRVSPAAELSGTTRHDTAGHAEAGDIVSPAAELSGTTRHGGDRAAASGGSTGTASPTRRETLRRSSPVAAKIAAAHGIDVMRLSGSGRNGRVTKADVLRAVELGAGSAASLGGSGSNGKAVGAPADEPPMHIESPYRRDPSVPVAGSPSVGGAAPAASASPSAEPAGTRRRGSATDAGSTPATDELGGTVVPLTRMRSAIGAQMRKALDTAAHATTIVECDMSRIERQRRELGVTALPLVARHVLDTLREFPALNATYDGQTLIRFERVHLGVAVSLGEDGLIVPVIHDAQELAPEGLAGRIKDVAGRARAGELSPDEVRGGTFTITNPGAAGALIATPILNVPQVAILDLEAIVKRPVVVTDADGQDSIAIRPMTHLCMSWDHRVLDGMYAARFLTALRGRIEGRP